MVLLCVCDAPTLVDLGRSLEVAGDGGFANVFDVEIEGLESLGIEAKALHIGGEEEEAIGAEVAEGRGDEIEVIALDIEGLFHAFGI